MANNIDTSLNSYRLLNGTADSSRTREEATTSSASRSAGKQSAGDTVEVTQSARSLASLETAISASSVVDQNRVDSIRASIAEGSYAVNSEQVANKLLTMDQSLPVA